ncbi:hypothetical protein MACK_000426 [Theileria orientalis]|uniref:Uncharacterized protein n=1 Tax=Theileria orientalis TaxID=68886 RepID=A0A976MC31_THEOR|nr:hypothetical protein MACK_000426 [Theileria orientalis]
MLRYTHKIASLDQIVQLNSLLSQDNRLVVNPLGQVLNSPLAAQLLGLVLAIKQLGPVKVPHQVLVPHHLPELVRLVLNLVVLRLHPKLIPNLPVVEHNRKVEQVYQLLRVNLPVHNKALVLNLLELVNLLVLKALVVHRLAVHLPQLNIQVQLNRNHLQLVLHLDHSLNHLLHRNHHQLVLRCSHRPKHLPHLEYSHNPANHNPQVPPHLQSLQVQVPIVNKFLVGQLLRLVPSNHLVLQLLELVYNPLLVLQLLGLVHLLVLQPQFLLVNLLVLNKSLVLKLLRPVHTNNYLVVQLKLELVLHLLRLVLSHPLVLNPLIVQLLRLVLINHLVVQLKLELVLHLLRLVLSHPLVLNPLIVQLLRLVLINHLVVQLKLELVLHLLRLVLSHPLVLNPLIVQLLRLVLINHLVVQLVVIHLLGLQVSQVAKLQVKHLNHNPNHLPQRRHKHNQDPRQVLYQKLEQMASLVNPVNNLKKQRTVPEPNRQLQLRHQVVMALDQVEPVLEVDHLQLIKVVAPTQVLVKVPEQVEKVKMAVVEKAEMVKAAVHLHQLEEVAKPLMVVLKEVAHHQLMKVVAPIQVEEADQLMEVVEVALTQAVGVEAVVVAVQLISLQVVVKSFIQVREKKQNLRIILRILSCSKLILMTPKAM